MKITLDLTAMELHNLLPPISPIGEANYDAKCLKNAKDRLGLIDEMVGAMMSVYFEHYKTHEHSKQEMVRFCRQELEKMHKEIGYFLEDTEGDLQ